MAYLEPKLVVKVSQKQVLTPGLVQMVSLLTLNKLELTEMIQQELVQNPVLEEGTEIVETSEPEIDLNQDGPAADVDTTDAEYQGLMEAAARDHCVTDPEPTPETTVEVAAPAEPEQAVDDPYADIDFQSFDNYLNDNSSRPRETEIFEKPSFENFLAKPQTLTDHLEWQLGLATVDESIRLACHSIIGNLNEDGYLCAVDENGREVPITLEEIAESGDHTLEDVQKALQTNLDASQRGGYESEEEGLKRKLSQQAAIEDGLRAREADAAQLLSAEQSRWIDLNSRLDELEQLLGPVR